MASLAIELKDQVKAIDIILVHPDEAYAYAATLSRKKDRVAEKLEALLVNVGPAMNDTLFARTHSVVFASATLVVDDRFDAFESALGLNASEFSACRNVPFRFELRFRRTNDGVRGGRHARAERPALS